MPFEVTVCGDEAPATKPDRRAIPAGDGRPSTSRLPGAWVMEDFSAGATAGLAAGAAMFGIPSLRSLAPELTVRRSLAGVTLPLLADVLARPRRRGARRLTDAPSVPAHAPGDRWVGPSC